MLRKFRTPLPLHPAQDNLLRQVAPRPQYAVALLNILKVPSFSAGVKQQAAIQFKNHIKKYWAAVRVAR